MEDQLLADIAGLNHGGLPVPGTVGVVVGATLEPSAFDLAGLGGVVLAPGLGVQGGTAEDAGRLFGACPTGTVLPSSSRALLAAGPDAGALRAAAHQQCEALRGGPRARLSSGGRYRSAVGRSSAKVRKGAGGR